MSPEAWLQHQLWVSTINRLSKTRVHCLSELRVSARQLKLFSKHCALCPVWKVLSFHHILHRAWYPELKNY